MGGEEEDLQSSLITSTSYDEKEEPIKRNGNETSNPPLMLSSCVPFT